MIRHVVMWELIDAADAAFFAEQLLTCRDIAPGALAFHVGRRSDGLAATMDVCLVADFVDAEAVRAYAEHPRHLEVSAGLTALRRTRHVLDFEMFPSPPGRAGSG